MGEEGSDPVVLKQGEPWRQDQFAQSGHYDNLEADLVSIADLGVELVRYGTPWRLAEPSPGSYDWALWDRALAACEHAGLTPIVEFVHFGLPDHYRGFVDPAWVDGFRRYVDAFAARYPDPVMFTPINEPGVTARFSARLGMWNDRLASTTSYVAALANLALANLEAMARLRADRDAWWIGSEGFDMPIPVDAEAAAEADRIRDASWLIWDLQLGTEPSDLVVGYLDTLDDQLRSRIAGLAINDKLVAGLDIYPVSLASIGGEATWSVADRMALIDAEIRRWHDRYQVPFWVAETSNLTLPVSEQIPWLDALAACQARLRADGFPARGICWYSRGDQYDWQTALTEPTGAVTEVGLFDADRNPREVANRFAALADAGAPAVP